MLFFKETNQTHIRPPANPSGTPIAFSPWGDTAHLTSHYWFRRTPYATKINPRLHLPPFDLAKPLAPSFQAGVTAGVFRRKTTEHHRFRSARLSPQSWHSIPLSYLYQVHIYICESTDWLTRHSLVFSLPRHLKETQKEKRGMTHH